MSLGNIEAILNQLERFLTHQDGKSLPDGQRAVLHGLLLHPTWKYEQLAVELEKLGLGRYKPQTLKNEAYKVFQRLTIALKPDTKIKKSTVRRSVLAWHKSLGTSVISNQPLMNPVSPMQMPGNFLHFDAWQADLAHLTQQVADGRRIIGIHGAPRSGKTYFAYGLCDRLTPLFESPPLWCLAPHVPTPEALYHTLIKHLDEPASPEPAIPALMDLFRSRRLLIVVDNTEALYQPQHLAGHFKPVAADYDTWLRQLLEMPMHQSCLLWVGREPPACFAYPHGVLAVHQVDRLKEQDVLALLGAANVSLDAAEQHARLVQFCGGNPAWLLMVVTRIQQLYKGDVAMFLASPSLPEEVLETLAYTLECLSLREWLLLIWLLLQPFTPEQLLHSCIPGLSLDEQREALLSLQNRGLIEEEGDRPFYQINPPLLRYGIARRITSLVTAELMDGTPDHLRYVPLFNTVALVGEQVWQQEYLLGAIAKRLQQRLAFRQEQQDCLQQCLVAVRQLPPHQQGYAAGNLLNLVTTLHLPLADFDWTGLELYHADLRSIQHNPITLANGTLHHPLLPMLLGDRSTATLSPDGQLIAAGDRQGHLLCWRREESGIQLHALWQADAGIDLIQCPDSDTLWIVAGQTAYTWWMDDEPQPRRILELPETASCLAHSALGQVAIGLSQGDILLWDGSPHSPRLLEAHRAEICNLAFSADGLQLASVDRDNRVLEWQIPRDPSLAPQYKEFPPHAAICLAVSWEGTTLLRAEASPYRLRLWLGEADFQDQPIADEWVTALQFNADGRYLVGWTEGDRLFQWDWTSASCTFWAEGAIAHSEALALTGDGRWLLVTTLHHLQLWDTYQQIPIWQIETSQGKVPKTTVKNVAGLSSVEVSLLQALGIILE